jgi:SAM-dependent MidA family methyltransferase
VSVVNGGLEARIAARARRFGPLPWSAFMEAALYDPADGFYEAGGRAGRDGDFVTSPERGPLFAAVCARALDRCWQDLGRPDPFVVIEAAAGAGTLARDVLAAGPACSPALRYVLVERSSALRTVQATRLPLEHPALVLGPAALVGDDDEDELEPVPGAGPLVTSLAELPAVAVTGVVLANELLDNLAVDLLEWRDGRWHEVLVAAADWAGPPGRGGGLAAGPASPSEGPAAGARSTGGALVELVVPAPPDVAAEAARLVGGVDGLAEGARIPRQRAAGEWLGQALATVQRGRVIVIDYGDTTDALARRPQGDWLRTFRRHQAAVFPLQQPGTQDITCVVAWDQLAWVRPPDANRSQGAWLAAHGLEELVAPARARWQAGAAVGDLAALTARSRVHEAQALSDPAGLGGHRVLEWVIR